MSLALFQTTELNKTRKEYVMAAYEGHISTKHGPRDIQDQVLHLMDVTGFSPRSVAMLLLPHAIGVRDTKLPLTSLFRNSLYKCC